MKTFFRLLALLRKELLQLFQNPKMRTSLLIPPLIQPILLGYAATLDLKEVACAFLDYSQTAESRELKSQFAGSPTFRMKPELESEADLKSKIENRKIQLAVVIPANFGRAAAGHSRPAAQVIVDGRSASSAGMAMAYASNILNEYSRKLRPEMASFRVQTRAWFNPNFNMQYFMVPSLLAMIALIDVMMVCSLSIAREREDGTFDQLRMTPFAAWELLFAKGCSAMIVGIIQLALGLLITRFWFQVPFQSSYFLLAGLLASFLAASITLGLFVSILSQNLQQALLVMLSVVLPFALLSGMGTPLESMPDFFQKITIINPLRHGIDALPRIFLEGTTFADLKYSFVFLWSIAAAAFTTTYVLFAKQR